MPIPKLLTIKGKVMPEWNLTRGQLKKQQAAFRAAASLKTVSFMAAGESVKKAAKKKSASKKTAKKVSGSKAAASSLVSIKHKDLMIDRVKMADMVERVMSRQRKDQKTFTATEWNAFIAAIQAIAAPGAASPTFKEIVSVHVKAMTHAGHSWRVHTMEDMDMEGTNFLAWHREYVAKMEARLMLVNPLVTIPYWNWTVNRAIPAQLKNPSDLAAWGITRGSSLNPGDLPTQADIDAVVEEETFEAFQSALEEPHNWVHSAVDGTMVTSSSPADPLFWLHHAFIDKIWADWQEAFSDAPPEPSNLTEKLQPSPIITRKVSEVLNTNSLGYVYA
jgi:tyrosinase